MTLQPSFWEKYYEVYDALNELISYQDLLAKFITFSGVTKGSRVLDLGSGSGNLAIKFEELGADVVGIDSSEEAIKVHLKKNPSAQIIKGNITHKLPFNDSFFDVICSNNVIYTIHPNQREGLFSELHRVMKSGGVIIISNINKGFSPAKIYVDHISTYYKKHGLGKTIISIVKFIYPTILIFWYNYKIKKAHIGGDYKFMDEGDQENLLTRAGFKVSTHSLPVYSKQAFLVKGYK